MTPVTSPTGMVRRLGRTMDSRSAATRRRAPISAEVRTWTPATSVRRRTIWGAASATKAMGPAAATADAARTTPTTMTISRVLSVPTPSPSA